MFEGGDEARSFFRIVAQPVEELCEAPFGGIDTAAPIDRRDMHFARDSGNLRGFFPRAMVAPEIVVVERHQIFADGDYARAGGVEGDCRYVISLDPSGSESGAHGCCQSVHMICMALRGEIRIFALSMQGIIRGGKAEAAALAIEERNADVERAEVDAGDDDAHGAGPAAR